MTSTDWMHDNGAPLLPKVSPYCIPMKMMELKRRPTLYDIRGSGWQLRHKRATPGEEVPWERVFHWPPKQIHVITNQELFKPGKQKKKRVVKKGAKVVKAPPTPVREKKFVAKFIVRYDFQRVLNYLDKRVGGAQAAKRAPAAASADAATASTTAPTARKIFSRPLVPGAFPDDDAAAADVDAQTSSAADDKAQPSLLATIFSFAFGLFFGRGASKRAHEDDVDNASGVAKRRRVGLDAQAPARAEARPVAGKAARTTTTGATAPKQLDLTANAAQRRARINAPKASLIVCPPPTRNAPVAGNAKVVKALSMLPPLAPAARLIAGRPTRKRADTPDPRAGTPSEPEASSAVSTPTSSPSSSRSSSPASSRSPSPSPSPAPKSESKLSMSKSSSSKSKSSSESKSSSSKSKSTSSKSTSSSSESSSSKSKSSPSESKSSSKSQPSAPESKSTSPKSTSSIKPWHTKKPMAERSSLELAMDPSTVSGSTAIMLLPPNIRWSRDGELVNPWDPRCPAAPDPVFPWAPACEAWVNARAAPIAPLPSAPSPPSFVRPTRSPAAGTSAPHRAGSPVRGEFSISSGEETEVESGGEETDDEE